MLKVTITAATLKDILKSKGQDEPVIPTKKELRVYVPKNDTQKLRRKTRPKTMVNLKELMVHNAKAFTRMEHELKEFFNAKFKGLSPDWKIVKSTKNSRITISNPELQDSWVAINKKGDGKRRTQWNVKLSADLTITANLVGNNLEIIAKFTAKNGSKKILEKTMPFAITAIDDLSQHVLENNYLHLYRFITNMMMKADDMCKH
jgi:hypothetical protein